MSTNKESFPTSSTRGGPSTSTAALAPGTDRPEAQPVGLGINSVPYDSDLAPQSPAVNALKETKKMLQNGQISYLDCDDCCRRKHKSLDAVFEKIVVWNSSEDTCEISDKSCLRTYEPLDSHHCQTSANKRKESRDGVLFKLPQNHWSVRIPHLKMTINLWAKLGWRNYHRVFNTPLEFLLVEDTKGIDGIYETYPSSQ